MKNAVNPSTKLRVNILAFDTSTDRLSVAVASDGKVLKEIESQAFIRHSEALVPALEKVLKSAHLKLEDIHVIAPGIGPGSFTGVRVGVTVAKLLAYTLKKKLIGVTGFEAIAEGAPIKKGSVAMMMDARRSMVYASIYEKKENSNKIVLKPCLMSAEAFLVKAKKADFFVEGAVSPKAGHIAEIAFRKWKKKEFFDPFKLEPLYIHARDCNVTRA